jgi:hypothetical protein
MSKTATIITEEQIARVLGMRAFLVIPTDSRARPDTIMSGKVVTMPDSDKRSTYKFLFKNPDVKEPWEATAYHSLFPHHIKGLKIDGDRAVIVLDDPYALGGGYFTGETEDKALRDLKESGL